MEGSGSRLADSRLLRWAVAAAILGGTAIVITFLILRAIPDEVEVEVEIAGWRVPVGVVVSTEDVDANLPGFILGALLGDTPKIQIDAGRIERSLSNELTIRSFSGADSTTYNLTDRTRIVDVRSFLAARPLEEGELAAVITSPGGEEALLVLTHITSVAK